jgi:hypothetical protein
MPINKIVILSAAKNLAIKSHIEELPISVKQPAARLITPFLEKQW